MASILDTTNLSYWSIPVAFALAMGPRVYSGIAGPGKAFLDPQNPRTMNQNLERAEADGKLDKELRQRLQRAENCTANAFENLPLFAAAVTAANASAALPLRQINLLAGAYLGIRALYTWVYIWGQNDRRLAPARPVVWLGGISVIMHLFVTAGRQSRA